MSYSSRARRGSVSNVPDRDPRYGYPCHTPRGPLECSVDSSNSNHCHSRRFRGSEWRGGGYHRYYFCRLLFGFLGPSPSPPSPSLPVPLSLTVSLRLFLYFSFSLSAPLLFYFLVSTFLCLSVCPVLSVFLSLCLSVCLKTPSLRRLTSDPELGLLCLRDPSRDVGGRRYPGVLTLVHPPRRMEVHRPRPHTVLRPVSENPRRVGVGRPVGLTEPQTGLPKDVPAPYPGLSGSSRLGQTVSTAEGV